MACTSTYATLRIFSKSIPPYEISKMLGLEPTKLREIKTDSKYKHERETNAWLFTTKQKLISNKNHKHIEYLLKMLANKEFLLKSLRDVGCETDIFCYWEGNEQGGPSMSLDIMKRLVDMGLPVTWDNYFCKDDENA